MLRSTYRSSFLSITRRSPCRSLVEWIDRVARGEGLSYEVILVDDGSGDGSWRVIENLHERFAAVRGIKFARNYGKSAALYCGFAEARGEVVFHDGRRLAGLAG